MSASIALNDRLADRQARCFPLSSRGGLGATSRNHFCFIHIRSDCRAEEPQADEGSTAAWDHPRVICTRRNLRGSTSVFYAERTEGSPYSLRMTCFAISNVEGSTCC